MKGNDMKETLKKGGITMHQRWLRTLFRRRVLTIFLLLLQVWFLVNLVIGGSQLSQQLKIADVLGVVCSAVHHRQKNALNL